MNADGSIAAGDGFTVAKGAAGFYTLAFASGFRLTNLVASPAAHNNAAVQFNYSTSQILVSIANTNVATDLPFSFIAVGVQQ